MAYAIKSIGHGESCSSIPEAWDKLDNLISKKGFTRDDFPIRFAISDTYETDAMGFSQRKISHRKHIILGIADSEETMYDAFWETQDNTGLGDLNEVVRHEWGSTRFSSQSVF
jgi:hypothetical protein